MTVVEQAVSLEVAILILFAGLLISSGVSYLLYCGLRRFPDYLGWDKVEFTTPSDFQEVLFVVTSMLIIAVVFLGSLFAAVVSIFFAVA